MQRSCILSGFVINLIHLILKQVYEDVGQADEIFYTKRVYAVKYHTIPDEDRDEDHTCGHPLSVSD
jgi:hypothetical protein